MGLVTMNGQEDNATKDGGHPPWFDHCDEDFVTLQKIIVEPILLESSSIM